MRVFTAGIALSWVISPGAIAQDFGTGTDFVDYVRRTCGALSQLGEDRTSTQSDLFFRCNGALNAPGSSTDGLTGQADILDQYIGVQGISSQSDGLSRTNRADQFISARLNVISGQMRSGQFADLLIDRPVLLASTEPDTVELSSTRLSREGRWDGFASLGGFESEQDSTSDELGFEADGVWFAGGLDYSFSDRLIGGAALSYVDSSADFDGIGGLSSGGSTDTESVSLSLYGSYLISEPFALNAWELNGLLSVGQSDFETSRVISVVDKNGGGINDAADGNFATVNRTATSSTDADTVQASLGAAYSMYYENGVSLTPSANLTYYYSEIGGFGETGSNGLDLVFDDQEIDSLQASIGANISRAVSADWGVLVPYARGNAVFELQDTAQTVRGRYTVATNQNDSFIVRTNDADEFVVDVAVGASAQFANGASAFAEYSTILGLENVDHQAISVGVRFEF
ncbi:MAG: autotransporter outer membrane beta-barrel domain-containing protein [Pseudomonadota bacterium]